MCREWRQRGQENEVVTISLAEVLFPGDEN
jgi:hypothetical protein